MSAASQDSKTCSKYLLEMEGKSCSSGMIVLAYLLTQKGISTSTLQPVHISKVFYWAVKSRKALKHKPEPDVIGWFQSLSPEQEGCLNLLKFRSRSPFTYNQSCPCYITLKFTCFHVCISEDSCIFSVISTYSYASGPSYFLQSECLLFGKYWNKLKWDLYDVILAMCVFSSPSFRRPEQD